MKVNVNSVNGRFLFEYEEQCLNDILVIGDDFFFVRVNDSFYGKIISRRISIKESTKEKKVTLWMKEI